MLLERAKSAEPPSQTDRVAETAARVATEAGGAGPRADHRRDLARTLVDNFGDTAAIEFVDDIHLERLFRAILQHRRLWAEADRTRAAMAGPRATDAAGSGRVVGLSGNRSAVVGGRGIEPLTFRV